MKPQDKTSFIMDNLIMGINCELYKDNNDKWAIDWVFYNSWWQQYSKKYAN